MLVDLPSVSSLKWNFAKEENIVADPKGPNVHLVIVSLLFLIVEELWGHVIRSPEFGERKRLVQFGEPKIANDNFIVVNHDIGQLQVPMHYFGLAEHLKSFEHLLQKHSGQLLPDSLLSILLLILV